ncbi:MAG: ATP synthase F1 subunit epsilon [Rickettsiales bacterium]|jgi:F-type H+-transporting ATPase subunit epsilon
MQVQLITPEKILFEGVASYVQVCGSQGEFGVLPNHSPLVSTLREGSIIVTLANGEKEEFHVVSGVAEVLPESVTLLVETA